jgi:hypothetical protein
MSRWTARRNLAATCRWPAANSIANTTLLCLSTLPYLLHAICCSASHAMCAVLCCTVLCYAMLCDMLRCTANSCCAVCCVLCRQITAVAKQLSHHAKFRAVCVSAATRMSLQKRALAAPIDVLVATPTRLLQHAEAGNVALGDVVALVIDEADTMFDQGFGAEISRLLKALKNKAQPGEGGRLCTGRGHVLEGGTPGCRQSGKGCQQRLVSIALEGGLGSRQGAAAHCHPITGCCCHIRSRSCLAPIVTSLCSLSPASPLSMLPSSSTPVPSLLHSSSHPGQRHHDQGGVPPGGGAVTRRHPVTGCRVPPRGGGSKTRLHKCAPWER